MKPEFHLCFMSKPFVLDWPMIKLTKTTVLYAGVTQTEALNWSPKTLSKYQAKTTYSIQSVFTLKLDI